MNIISITNTNDQEKALFYVRETIENNWAKRTEESTNE